MSQRSNGKKRKYNEMHGEVSYSPILRRPNAAPPPIKKRRKMTITSSKKQKMSKTCRMRTNKKHIHTKTQRCKSHSPPVQKNKKKRKILRNKINEFRNSLNKTKTQKENELKNLQKEEKKALAEIKKKYRMKRLKIQDEKNIQINDFHDKLNSSIIDYESDEKQIFCRNCFEKTDEELRCCVTCKQKLCGDCVTECDNDTCNVVFCEKHADRLSRMRCGICTLCTSCKINGQHENNCIMD
eukprot:345817_1